MALIPASLTLPGFQGEGLGCDAHQLVWKQHWLRSPLSLLSPPLKGTLVDFVKFSTWIYADYRCKRAFLNQSGGFELQQEGSSDVLYYIQRTRLTLFTPISSAFFFLPCVEPWMQIWGINLALFVWQHPHSSIKKWRNLNCNYTQQHLLAGWHANRLYCSDMRGVSRLIHYAKRCACRSSGQSLCYFWTGPVSSLHDKLCQPGEVLQSWSFHV